MSRALNLTVLTVVFAIILAVTAISDLDWVLSQKLVSHGSTFGEFFNRFGETPAFIALFASILLLFGCRNRQAPLPNVAGHIFALPFLGLFAWLIFWAPFRYVYEFEPNGVPTDIDRLTLILGGLLLIAAVTMAYKLPSGFFRQYRRPAIFIIILIVLEVLLVNLTKIAWGRPRMRAIVSIDQFHHWYQIAGPAVSEEFKSFPSGHTANGFMAIVFALLIPADRASLVRGITLFALCWGICVALSRVVLGAHFLSDVAAGGYIALLLYYTLEPWSRAKIHKNTWRERLILFDSHRPSYW